MTKVETEHSSGKGWLDAQTPPLSRIGLGTVAFGRTTGLKYKKPIVRPGDKALLELLATARKLGINLLDTATAYGDSQVRLGALIADDPYWVVMTKVGERHAGGRSTYDFSRDALEADLERARSELRRDTLDIVLLHSNGNDEPALMTGQALETLKRAQSTGVVRCIGASLKTTAGIEAAWAAEVDLLMLTLNKTEPELAPRIRESDARGIRVVIKKPLASGTLTTDSLGWVASQPGVSSVIVGTLNPDHLRANVAAVNRALSDAG
ncbi:MAG: aldo/keto reductase [Pseudomonadota bacterium]